MLRIGVPDEAEQTQHTPGIFVCARATARRNPTSFGRGKSSQVPLGGMPKRTLSHFQIALKPGQLVFGMVEGAHWRGLSAI